MSAVLRRDHRCAAPNALSRAVLVGREHAGPCTTLAVEAARAAPPDLRPRAARRTAQVLDRPLFCGERPGPKPHRPGRRGSRSSPRRASARRLACLAQARRVGTGPRGRPRPEAAPSVSRNSPPPLLRPTLSGGSQGDPGPAPVDPQAQRVDDLAGQGRTHYDASRAANVRMLPMRWV